MSESLFTKFFDAMQDRVARHDIEAEQLLERNFKKNKFSGKTTFTGIVMSDPGSTGTTQEGMVTANNFKPIKVFIEGIDDAMVDPLEIANSAPEEERQNMFTSVVGGLLTAYPSSELQGTDPTSQIQLGSKVELQFYDQGPQTANHGKMRGLRYIRVLNSSDSRYSAIAGQFEPVALSSFGADGGSIGLNGGLGLFENLAQALNFQIPPGAASITELANYVTNPESLVKGPGIPQVTAIVESELARWGNGALKERDPQQKPILTEYWNNVIANGDIWYSGNKWTPMGTAWSAAFISFVLKDTDFKGSGSHLRYTKKNGDSNWQLFSLTKPGTIKAQVGDILEYTGHSDIVYKIEGDTAITVGGNLGAEPPGNQSAKITRRVPLNNGNYNINAAGYELVLKKMK